MTRTFYSHYVRMCSDYGENSSKTARRAHIMLRISVLGVSRRCRFAHYAPAGTLAAYCKSLFLHASIVCTLHTTPALWRVGLGREPQECRTGHVCRSHFISTVVPFLLNVSRDGCL